MVSQYLPRIGGLEQVVSDLSEHLAAEGHEIHVVTPYPSNLKKTRSLKMEEVINDVHVHRFKGSKFQYPLSIDWLYAMFQKLKQVIKRYHIQVIHAHFAKIEGVVGAAVGKKLGIPVVTTAHGSDLMFEWGGYCENRWSRQWVKYALGHADMVTTVSNALKQNAITLGTNPDKIRVIHNWIDASKFKLNQSKATLRRELGWEDGSEEEIILTARRLVKKNGIDLLLGAMKILSKKNLKNFKLIILGEGPEKEDLINQSKKLDAKIEFIDFVKYDQYIKMLNTCDMFVIPSRWEGFGMVVLEAMAAKSAVVGTNVGGIPEIIEHNKTGILVSPTSQSIAKGIRMLLDEPEKREKLVRNAGEKVSKYFAWPRAREQWLDVYGSSELRGR